MRRFLALLCLLIALPAFSQGRGPQLPLSNGIKGPTNCPNGYVPQWNAVNGLAVSCGLPAGTTGNNTLIETLNTGLLSSSVVPPISNIQGGSTNELVYQTAANTTGFATVGNGLNFSGGVLSASNNNVIAGYINGFTLSNDGGSPNTVLDIASGYAADSTNAAMITGTTFTKKTGGSWSAGSGGYMCSVTTSTWYHVYAIINSGSYDVYCDTSNTAANKPTNTTYFRYIGSFKTDGSSNILAFTQYGQFFKWATNKTDLSGAATSETAFTVSTPLGFVTRPNIYYIFSPGSSGNSANIFPGTSTSYDLIINGQITGVIVTGFLETITDTSSQLSYVVSGSSVLEVFTTGYLNPHVAPNF